LSEVLLFIVTIGDVSMSRLAVANNSYWQ